MFYNIFVFVMAKINDNGVYPPSSMIDGATFIGSLPNGQTVQFNATGLKNYIYPFLDFVNYDNATRVGQNIIGNDPDFPDTFNANINNGDKYFGTIKVFPPDSDTDINFITRLRSR